MQNRPNDLLLLAGQVLAGLMQLILAVAGAACILAAPLLLIFQSDINAELAKEFSGAVGALPLLPTLALIALIATLFALAFVFFGKLRAIISTVGEGDPFLPLNAVRLETMAWIMLACQLIVIPLSGVGLLLARWAEPMDNVQATIDAGVELEGILLVIILFILARVFRHGAAMREDLEGTV